MQHPFSMSDQKGPEPNTGYSFQAGEDLPDSFRRILSAQIRTASALLVNDGHPTESAVHEARKCVKRARSALRLIRPAISGEFDGANRRLQQIGRTLSELRDAQALMETLVELEQDELKEGRSDAGLKHEFQVAFDRLTINKQNLTAAPRAKAAVQSASRSLTQFADDIPKLALDKIGFDVLASSLIKTLKRGRKACSRAYSHPDSEHFHDFRKRAKDLRFQFALLAALWPDVLSGYSASAKELEQDLGNDHNLAVLSDLLLKDLTRKDFSVLSFRIEEKQKSLRHRAKFAARRLYSDPPKSWRVRLRASWQAWQAGSK